MSLMFALNQTKQKKAVEKKVKADHDDQWNYKAKGPNGLEAYRLEQTHRDQDQKQTARDTKAHLKDIQAKGPDGLEAYRFQQTHRDQEHKQTARDTKAHLKDIQAKGPDGLEAYRFGQTARDQKQKQVARDQLNENHNFDLARSLFGGQDGTAVEDEE